MNTVLKLPDGWTLETHQGISQTYQRAIDSDGCKWYDIDGQWTLNVPWFRRSPGLAPHRSDDLAVVETVDGERAYPITEKGTIRIGKRRISPRRWNH
jgi:hypothetical protein